MSIKAEKNPLSKIRISNVKYPIIIGLAVVGYLLYRDFNPRVFDMVNFTWSTALWIFAAFILIAGRDVGYIIRIRILSDGQLGWKQAFRVIMLWEFTSAVTPSAVGGTSVAIIFVHKEGIGVGRSSAIVMLTSFLDEIYFILMFPLMLVLIGKERLFDISSTGGAVAQELIWIALIGYSLKLIYTIILSYGIFFNPRGLKWLLLKIFKVRFLRRWYRSVNNIGTDIINSSKDIKSRNWKFWAKTFGATFISWSSRYFVANLLILALFGMSDQLLLFARQLVMWIMMLVMPTPGGSGFAEYIFTVFLGDLMPVPADLTVAAATLTAVIWRFITYYPYLIAGMIIFPRWVKRHFSKSAFPK